LVRSIVANSTTIRQGLEKSLAVGTEHILSELLAMWQLVEVFGTDPALVESLEATKIATDVNTYSRSRVLYLLERVLVGDWHFVRMMDHKGRPVTLNWQHPPGDIGHDTQVGEGSDLEGDMLPVNLCEEVFDEPSQSQEERGFLVWLIMVSIDQIVAFEVSVDAVGDFHAICREQYRSRLLSSWG
jgi:hypothetical protein